LQQKKWHFCLFRIAVQGVSLWHFHVYMYYNPNWPISSVFLLSTLVEWEPTLMRLCLPLDLKKKKVGGTEKSKKPM
jgi:hypothetical protein